MSESYRLVVDVPGSDGTRALSDFDLAVWMKFRVQGLLVEILPEAPCEVRLERGDGESPGEQGSSGE